MDYKKLIRKRETRLKLLRLLDFVPDKTMIKLQYRIKTGRKLNLKNPKRYTEKLQWYKLYYRDPLITRCSDKYQVRQYVKEKGFESILNTLYGVYENPEDIEWRDLPDSFVIKHTNGSGNNLFIKNKMEVDANYVMGVIDSWSKKRSSKGGREWGYYNVPSRIIIEKMLERDENNDIPDYKFFCFNGKAKYLYVMIDYVDDHSKGKCSFFTPEFEQLPYRRSEYMAIDSEIPKPACFEEMVRIAEVLSKAFPHVRVDLYNMKGKIVFGELTFYPASGYTVFEPDEFDLILGDSFELSENKKWKSL